jgi:hypothetical protein
VGLITHRHRVSRLRTTAARLVLAVSLNAFMACKEKTLHLRFNSLKTKINLKYILIFSSYRAVNILRLSYKTHSINDVLIVKYWLCGLESYTTHVNTLCRQMPELLYVEHGGPKVSTAFKRFTGNNQWNVEARHLKI